MSSIVRILTAALAVTLTACGATVTRVTPTALREDPGSVIEYSAQVPFDYAYSRVKEQMIICYTATYVGLGSSLQWHVVADRGDDYGQISWISSSPNFGTKTMATILIMPYGPETRITSYLAYTKPQTRWGDTIRAWVEQKSERCDGT